MTDAATTVVVLLAPARGRMTVDASTGAVDIDDRGATLSSTDAAALETALGLGETWGVPVTAVSVGRGRARMVLGEALMVGVDRAVQIDLADDADPAVVASALGVVVGSDSRSLVVAGAHGVDVASGAVPAFLAHELGAEQALGLLAVEPGEAGNCEVIRRLDRGARERLAVGAPAVISVEGSVASLRRAGLRSVLATEESMIERVDAAVVGGHPSILASATPRPWRPRAHVVESPVGVSALDRIRDLTGVGAPAHQARTVEADPAEAATLILEQLGDWGFGTRHD